MKADSEIGRDEWVSQVEGRSLQRTGWRGRLLNRWEALSYLQRMVLVAALLFSLPLFTEILPILSPLGLSTRVGATFLAFSMLAIGLNVVVGYAGLLDLGYVAFFGIAGYAYAYISSDFIGGGVHVPSIVSLPLIVLFTAGVGWALGSSSLRLRGDYLAIVTLGFGLLFVQLTNTLTRVKIPGIEGTVDLTRGPNGINLLDEISLFGFTFKTSLQYYFLFLVALIIVYLVVDRINDSRTGRAWRAMREDELAAEVMGMPTRRLKLLAFAIGAAIAGLAGVLFAAWQGNVVPNRYGVLLLIELYAMVVLGGLGSLPGVILGAFVFTVMPEVLRDPALAGILFSVGMLAALTAWLGFSRRLAAILAGTVVAGLILKLAVGLLVPGLDGGAAPAAGSIINQVVQAWLILPKDLILAGNLAIAVAALLLVGVSRSSSGWRWLWLGMALYFLAFSWETRLAAVPSVTRILVVGIVLIVIMIVRPQGLLGKLRVTTS